MSAHLSAKIRADFPLLAKKIRGKNLVYLDSAATALKPWPVIERISQFYSYETANVHRGAHFLADQATRAFEESREAVRAFINASSTDEIVFTKGTTESFNLLAQAWGRKNLQAGDEILLTTMEHHANIVPWQMIAEEKSALVKVVQLTADGEIDELDLKNKLSSKTKIFSFTACSNVLGTLVPVAKLAKIAKSVGALVVVDAAQIVANHPVDVKAWDVDFLAFSGHKVFGPYGVGVLYGKREILQAMPPYQGGGSMISEVRFEKTTYNDIPFRFEAGTPNIEAVIALKPALDYVSKLSWAEIHQHEQSLLSQATDGLVRLGARLFGTAKDKSALVSFEIPKAHASDVGQILDQDNIAVRTGHHCAQPLMRSLGISGTIRASFSIYNSADDVTQFLQGIEKAKGMLL